MTLSIIIPVYNEAKTLKNILSKVKRTKLPEGVNKEIIVVNDASTDETAKILIREKSIKVLAHEKNKGKGGAIVTGLKNSSGDMIIIQDADLEYDPSDYTRLLKPIITGKAKIVYGTRLAGYRLKLFGNDKTPHPTHLLGNRFLTFITNILYGGDITDMETGYKVFKREVLKGVKIKSNKFEFEPEITAKMLKRGYKIYEVPIKVKPRSYEEGKKITWIDGFSAVWTLFKYRFVD